MPALRIAEELKKPVWVVDTERGSFDPLLDVPMFRGVDTGLKALVETMTHFNRGRDDRDQLEMALDLVDGYPVRTPWGDLNRADLREKIFREEIDMRGQPTLLDRRFEMLDEKRALCIESWSTGRQDVSTGWTFLVKRENRWKIESLAQGETSE